ncbi:MAG: c-type cytochrome [Verrucomicrobiae bacterium]|nr:c-type cytochrome [Verrucomicrobiae bacterium]
MSRNRQCDTGIPAGESLSIPGFAGFLRKHRQGCQCHTVLRILSFVGWFGISSFSPADDLPVSSDPTLTITKFAGSDLIKQPTGITFTRDGKLLAIQSNTHFRPDDYDGPKSDQIVWLQDTDGDGVADQRSSFFEADLVATMDIATHPETGAIYIATRNEVLRVWDKDGDGKADPDSVERRLVFLDTTADYPHNGVSGLCFDDNGDLFFGIGENYGADYTLRGSDDSSVSDGGEGGNIWHVTRDGGELRRYATGFWNPFGVCHAPGGHVFATDNDPSGRPPSRLHYVIDGGDYGYQYRYGRSGQHPFISWNGELPGTLPMLHAAGEAPCDVIYHRGHLLVASWADHRIEQYPLTWDQTHFTTERKILVQGGAEFRPVAFAFGPDGALYVSDWVKKDYQLHGHGAVWRIEGWDPELISMPEKESVRVRSSLRQSMKTEDPWSFSRLLSDPSFGSEIGGFPWEELTTTRQKQAHLLAWRLHQPNRDTSGVIAKALADPDPTLRLLALKWICDKKLENYRAEVEAIAADPPSPTLFLAAVTTLARLDGQPVDDKPIQKLIGARLQATDASPKVRRAAFLVLANREKFLSIPDLRSLYADPASDDEFRIDVLLTLLVHANEAGAKAFAKERIEQGNLSDAVRPFAEEVARRAEALPAPSGQAIAGRPLNFDFESWSAFLKKLPAPSPEPQAASAPGRLVFHRHCAGCHRALGFGRQGGPDLSQIGQRGRDHILRSILDPSAEIAPQYEAWKLDLVDGSTRMGFMLGQQGPNHFYGDATGNQFEIYNRDIVTRAQVPVSLMPPGLVMTMTNDEIRDLVSWLASLK